MKNEMQDKVKGAVDKAIGRTKVATSKLESDQDLKAEGKAQVAKGMAEQSIGDVKSAVKDGAQKIVDKAKKLTH